MSFSIMRKENNVFLQIHILDSHFPLIPNKIYFLILRINDKNSAVTVYIYSLYIFSYIFPRINNMEKYKNYNKFASLKLNLERDR